MCFGLASNERSEVPLASLLGPSLKAKGRQIVSCLGWGFLSELWKTKITCKEELNLGILQRETL